VVFDFENIQIILALGNIGPEYKGTRHNVGFDFIDTWIGLDNFRENKNLKSFIKKFYSQGKTKIAALPTTMMNLSGESAISLLNYFNLQPENLLVIYDDLDISLGNFKLTFAKGPKGHNGVSDIEKKIKTQNFWHLRLGIENRTAEQRAFLTGKDYVLSMFDQNEIDILKSTFKTIIQTYLPTS
jgi:PTH1 family peptidyl-tRNA hydrolase